MRLEWLSPYQAPYREALWGELAQRCEDFRVHFLFRRDGVHDWDFAPRSTYSANTFRPRSVVEIRTRRARVPIGSRGVSDRIGYDPYVIARRPFLDTVLDGCEAVIVNGWDQPAYLQTLWAARRRGVGVVLFYESHRHRFTTGPVAAVRRRAFRFADVVLAPAGPATDAVRAEGVSPDRLVESVNAVDVAGLADAAEQARAGRLPGGPHRFVYVGQLIERKNVQGLLRALALGRPDWTLDIAGTGSMQAELEQLAVALGLGDRVTWHGHVPSPRIAAFVGTRHTLVMPSLEEVWGMVVNEGIACGLQIVVSADAGVAPSVRGITGVHLSTPDPAALAAAMADAARGWTTWLDGREQSRGFSPPAAAAHTMDAASRAVESARARRRAA